MRDDLFAKKAEKRRRLCGSTNSSVRNKCLSSEKGEEYCGEGLNLVRRVNLQEASELTKALKNKTANKSKLHKKLEK